jgi:hypothetical protein
MNIKAHWKSKNPFHPDINQLSYTKTVEVPDGTDMKVLEEFAKEDTKPGYLFDRIEVLT